MTQKTATNIQKRKFADITQNVSKTKNGAVVKADFLCGWVYQRVEKKAQNSDFD